MDNQTHIENRRLQAVSYYCFFIALMSCLGVLTASSDVGLLIALVIVALWYQAGVGVLRLGKKSWWLAIILLSLFSLSMLSKVYNTIIYPIFNPSVTGVGLVRWLTLLFGVISIICIYLLFKYRARFHAKVA